MVPARAEIIIEGIVPPKKRHYEGPFGEWPHYYYKEGEQPYIEVTAITMRKNPIYQSIHSAHFEHNIIGAAPRLGSLLRRIQEAVPSTTGVNMPISGAARSHCYISVKKRAEGEPKQAALAAFVTDPNIKLVIVHFASLRAVRAVDRPLVSWRADSAGKTPRRLHRDQPHAIERLDGQRAWLLRQTRARCRARSFGRSAISRNSHVSWRDTDHTYGSICGDHQQSHRLRGRIDRRFRESLSLHPFRHRPD